eukprot:1158247-Pelagomonas_calceolata.AAC.1
MKDGANKCHLLETQDNNSLSQKGGKDNAGRQSNLNANASVAHIDSCVDGIFLEASFTTRCCLEFFLQQGVRKGVSERFCFLLFNTIKHRVAYLTAANLTTASLAKASLATASLTTAMSSLTRASLAAISCLSAQLAYVMPFGLNR